MLKKYLMIFLVSMVPLIELRGAVPIAVGMNLFSFLTSGTLGIPGVCLLYSITWYQFL